MADDFYSARRTELTAAHQEGKPSHFHTYFDLDSFSILANTSMVEWSSVKIRPPTDSKIAGIQESLSCWGWAGVSFSPLSAYSIKTMCVVLSNIRFHFVPFFFSNSSLFALGSGHHQVILRLPRRFKLP